MYFIEEKNQGKIKLLVKIFKKFMLIFLLINLLTLFYIISLKIYLN